jgi:hypothetical protein
MLDKEEEIVDKSFWVSSLSLHITLMIRFGQIFIASTFVVKVSPDI